LLRCTAKQRSKIFKKLRILAQNNYKKGTLVIFAKEEEKQGKPKNQDLLLE